MVPEGLLPTLTLALVLTGRRMAARQVLIRHLPRSRPWARRR